MNFALHVLALIATLYPLRADAQERPDPLCPLLQAFVSSVPPDETREFTFHTIWGANFKDSSESALRATRCVHGEYDPAKAVCVYLVEHGAVEFSGHNAERALTCLSPGTHFAKRVDLRQGVFSLNYGTEERGSNVKILFKEDAQLGGMALQIVADGY